MVLPSWWSDVKQRMSAQGVGVDIWLPILWKESSGNPNAHNRGTATLPEDSVGLFQLNRRGGQGVGYTVQQLMDPRINAEIAARYIAPAIEKCSKARDGTISCVTTNSGHPGLVPYSDPRVLEIVRYQAAIRGASTDEQKWRALQALAPGPSPDPQPGGPPWQGLFPDLGINWDDAIAGALRGFWGPFAPLFPDARDVWWATAFGFLGVASLLIGANALANGRIADALTIAGPGPTKVAGVALSATTQGAQKAAGGVDAAIRSGRAASRSAASTGRAAGRRGAAAARGAADRIDTTLARGSLGEAAEVI